MFIKTHIGYNPEHFLLANFTTKFGSEWVLIIKIIIQPFEYVNETNYKFVFILCKPK